MIVACANGLLGVESRELLAHTPRFFNLTAVPFDFDPTAPAPLTWLKFLGELWGDDDESTNALQEFFGYVVSGRLDLHKILLLVGPTRAGKGVIARTLTALIGAGNVAGPTLSSLAGEFGLAPLLGKPLAIVSDARLSGRGSQGVVERLLAISGEDAITVNRKFRDQWTGRLPSRFMVISNELPQLGDASAAIAGRFVTLPLSKSWHGQEDTTLEDRIRGELTGILNWALTGPTRLDRRGAFTRPASTDEAYIALQDLASPVSAFIRDRCRLEHEIAVDDLWAAWKGWAEDNNHPVGTKQRFGRDLRAAHAPIRVVRPRDGEAPTGVSGHQPEGGVMSKGHIAPGRGPSRTKAAWSAQVRVPTQCRSYSGTQLELFPEVPPQSKREAVGHGPVGLLRALQRQGLEPDALEAAARLCLLLDAEAAAEDE